MGCVGGDILRGSSEAFDTFGVGCACVALVEEPKGDMGIGDGVEGVELGAEGGVAATGRDGVEKGGGETVERFTSGVTSSRGSVLVYKEFVGVCMPGLCNTSK